MRGPGVLHIAQYVEIISKCNSTSTQCSKWYEISDMEIFQITEGISDPPTNQGAYFSVLLSI